jgi:hypothetical protein
MEAGVEVLAVQIDRVGRRVGVREEGVLDLSLQAEERSNREVVVWELLLDIANSTVF